MIHAKAEQAKPDQLVPWVCDHNHGGGNHVVAVAFTRGNAIVSWNVQGLAHHAGSAGGNRG